MKIEVLGPGCARCQATEANVKKAVEELGLNAEIRKVTDIKEIATYGGVRYPLRGSGRAGEVRWEDSNH